MSRDNNYDDSGASLSNGELDAARYRWLRKQHWNDAAIAVVADPKKNVRLGTYCPSEELLDAAIDAAMLVAANV